MADSIVRFDKPRRVDLDWELGVEMDSPRGRIYLACRACETACPSGVEFWPLGVRPDGKRLVVLSNPERTNEPQGHLHVTVLVNWFDELRRRMPPGGK